MLDQNNKERKSWLSWAYVHTVWCVRPALAHLQWTDNLSQILKKSEAFRSELKFIVKYIGLLVIHSFFFYPHHCSKFHITYTCKAQPSGLTTIDQETNITGQDNAG